MECMVQLVNGNKGVVVITYSEEDAKENCISVFHRIISCVMEAKAEFCHSIRPKFFLLDPSQSPDYLIEDNLFAMIDVERVLASRGLKVVLSITGKAKLKRERLVFLRKFTLWNNLEFASVFIKLQDIVQDLYRLGVHLNLPQHLLDAIETDFPHCIERRRTELVRVWPMARPPMLVAPGTSPEANGLQSSGQGN